MDTEMINTIVEHQLSVWPMAKKNFDALAQVKRRAVPVGDFPSYVQHNPGRIRSTGAKVDDASVKARKCFLCAANRPGEQISHPFIEGWELLVNPYPILPVHFTIPSLSHRPQDRIPVEMAAMAELMPDMALFFNGAKAGASAPDHMHCQAVLSRELPLVKITEKFHPVAAPSLMDSSEWNISLPFQFFSAIIRPDEEGMKLLSLLCRIGGIDSHTGQKESGLVNAFFWIDPHGLLRVAIIPRRAHRPECFGDSAEAFMVSPGALDMAGIVVTPRLVDFERIDSGLLSRIYSDVAFSDRLPDIHELIC